MKIKPLAKNRKARFEYDIQKTFEAGIVLKGTEVKSIRSGQINLAESYCRVDEKKQVYFKRNQCQAFFFQLSIKATYF